MDTLQQNPDYNELFPSAPIEGETQTPTPPRKSSRKTVPTHKRPKEVDFFSKRQKSEWRCLFGIQRRIALFLSRDEGSHDDYGRGMTELASHAKRSIPQYTITTRLDMSEAAVTVRVRKFMRNPLLKRRQMVRCAFALSRHRRLRSSTLSVLLCPRTS